MKKIIIALSIGLVMTSAAYAAIPTDPVQIGILKREKGASQDTPTRVYVLVRYASQDGGVGTSNSPTLPLGSAVIWDATSRDGVTIRTTTTSADPAFAGITTGAILSKDAGITTNVSDDNGKRNWGYIQVYGLVTNARIVAGGTNANSAKDFFITSKDEGCITGAELSGTTTVTSVSVQSAAAASGSRGGIFLIAADSTSTTTNVIVEKE